MKRDKVSKYGVMGCWVVMATLSLSGADIDWKKMMTVAERKRDAQGQLLPLQSYDETIRRGMDFEKVAPKEATR